MFKKILFPTDGSESSLQAQKVLIEMAKTFQAKVTVLHSYEFLEIIPVYEAPYAYLDELEKYLKEQSQEIVENAIKQLKAENVEVEGLSLKGDPGYNITHVLEQETFDLVILGSRGLGAVKRLILGSVSNFVAHHTRCPVMIVPITEG